MNFNTGYGPGELTDKTRYKKKVFLIEKMGNAVVNQSMKP